MGTILRNDPGGSGISLPFIAIETQMLRAMTQGCSPDILWLIILRLRIKSC